ncbi:MAG: hypothetical protein R8N23_06590 [Reichenbachiella sp.]|uniref:hypothetical protein n=1 Tax=Reichenbachiella sp. TaxID=2184521 RepID=UPI002966DA48|nr:hypothetical protein [Reichenbachiella sp.]MDW3209512.1 hypothetical protein [Reichenbachiella sp.]
MMDVPSPHTHVFENGINHPLLYLWDAWSYIEGDTIHLYCLSVSRIKPDGTPLQPIERNDFPFHIRHFTSKNNGISWKDEGCFLNIDRCAKFFDSRNIWSGSISSLPTGEKLFAFTILEQVDDKHQFLQNIALASSKDGYVVDEILNFELSSPRKDWKKITSKGYYLGKPNLLGSNDGDENGPIMAWRDPFIFLNKNAEVNLFWGGKIAPAKSALVRAELYKKGTSYVISKLHKPMIVPDGNEFTQLELPKVVHDEEGGLFYLMISTCNRIYEGQSDGEVDKGVRMYKSESLDGPWISLGKKILGSEHLFGATVLRTDFQNNRLLCVAPYTDAAEDRLSLTFSSVFYLYLDDLRVEFLES